MNTLDLFSMRRSVCAARDAELAQYMMVNLLRTLPLALVSTVYRIIFWHITLNLISILREFLQLAAVSLFNTLSWHFLSTIPWVCLRYITQNSLSALYWVFRLGLRHYTALARHTTLGLFQTLRRSWSAHCTGFVKESTGVLLSVYRRVC